MPTKLGGRPADTEETREGRAYLRTLLYPAIKKLEQILNKSKDTSEVRKTSQYIVDHNLGRAAFQIYGQFDFHKTELILQAFLAGSVDQLPEVDKALLTTDEPNEPVLLMQPGPGKQGFLESVPDVVAEHTICDTEADKGVE